MHCRYIFSATRYLHETDSQGRVALGVRDEAHISGVGKTWRRGSPNLFIHYTRVPKS